jgi:hypothetical protein
VSTVNCPEHPEELLREEWGQGRTGFCLKCLKHYPLCTAARYMDICQKLKKHDGPHITAKGDEWEEPSP